MEDAHDTEAKPWKKNCGTGESQEGYARRPERAASGRPRVVAATRATVQWHVARAAEPPGPQDRQVRKTVGVVYPNSLAFGRQGPPKTTATDAWSALQAVQALDWGPTTSPIVGSALYIDTAGTVALLLSHAPVRASKQSERAKGLVYSVEGVWRLGEAMEVTLRTILPTNSSASAHPLPRRRRGARRRHTGGTQQRSRGGAH